MPRLVAEIEARLRPHRESEARELEARELFAEVPGAGDES